MNAFLFSAIALCLAGQGALAGYQQQQQQAGYGYNQRKMAPSPQTYGSAGYGQEQASYGGAAEQSSYDAGQAAGYGQQSGYGKQQVGQSYARPAASSYGQQSAGYAKAAPKYEEPSYPPMPFAWGYDINDGYGGAQYHKETGDEYGKRTGSYGYTDAYGVYRQVDYVADEHGFRATIKTNEPGTANESPADVELHAYEPPSNYYAGSSGYGKQSAGASYGASQSSAPGYGQQQQQSYAAPASSYSRPQASPGYGSGQQSAYAPARGSGYSTKSASYAAPRAQSYSAGGESYSSSSLVPVYQKVAAPAKAAPAAPAKRY